MSTHSPDRYYRLRQKALHHADDELLKDVESLEDDFEKAKSEVDKVQKEKSQYAELARTLKTTHDNLREQNNLTTMLFLEKLSNMVHDAEVSELSFDAELSELSFDAKLSELSFLLRGRLLDMEQEILTWRTELQPVLTMRMLVEDGLRKYNRTRMNSAFTLLKLYTDVLFPDVVENDKLKPDVSQDFATLQAPVDEASLILDLKNLLKALKDDNPVPLPVKHEQLMNCHICSSKRVSLRVAAALVLLQLQRGKALEVKVIFADEKFKPLSILEGGKITPFV